MSSDLREGAAPRWESILRVDRQAATPLYHQIEENLRRLINDGVLQPSDAMPSEPNLGQIYGVSRLTVRRALDELERDGLLSRRHGIGTFIADPKAAQIHPSALSFTDNMLQTGRVPSSRIISLASLPAPDEVADQLGLAQGAPVVKLVRLRLADGQPLTLETTFLPEGRVPGLVESGIGDRSLYGLLRTDYSIDIVAMDQAMEPTLVTDSEATLLEVEPHTAAIASEIIGFTNNGERIEFTWSVTGAGRGRFQFHFRRGDVGMRHFTQSRDTGK